MASIMLVNPRKRGGKKRRASTPKRRKKATRRRKSVARVAPRRRVKRRRSKSRRGGLTVIRRAPRMIAGYKANPIRGIPTFSQIKGVVVDAGIGGAGAIANDVILGMLPLPSNLRTGPVGIAVKGAGAIVLGIAVGKVAGASVGAKVTSGAMTVLLYNTLRGLAAQYAPGLNLGEYVDGMGEYVDGLGYLTPGMSLGPAPDGFSGASPLALPVVQPVGFGGDVDFDNDGVDDSYQYQ